MMADIAELKHMIISFRNTELQTLLQFAGRSKVGRKQELLTRALELLKNLNPQVQLKIQELYRVTVGARPPLTANSSAADLARLAASSSQREASLPSMVSSAAALPSARNPPSSENHVSAALQSAINHRNSNNNNSAMYMNGVASGSRAGGVMPPLINGAVHGGVRTVPAARSNQLQPQQQLGSRNAHGQQNGRVAAPVAAAPAAVAPAPLAQIAPAAPVNAAIAPVHPAVNFKRLPFYDNEGIILRPTLLRGPSRVTDEKGVRKQIFEGRYRFRLTAQQATRITLSCDQRPDAKMAFPVQLQMRCCAVNTSVSQPDNFPASINVRVNGKPAPLPNVIPSNRPGVEGKRPSKPVDITALCKLTPTADNEITVQWTADPNGRHHVVSVDLVKRLNWETLMKRLGSRGVTQAATTRSMIRQKMASDDGDDIAACDLRVSIQCPISKTRIKTPCRATSCNHVQCFDASTFMQMNERKPTWVCPVCDQDAHFDLLAIDGYFQQVVQSAGPNVVEISLSVDGTWTPLKANGKKDTSFQMPPSSSPSSSSSSSSSSTATSNCARNSNASTNGNSNKAAPPSTSSSSSTSSAPKRTVEAVDLTLDSDDEDDESSKPPPAKRPSVSQHPQQPSQQEQQQDNADIANGSGNTTSTSSSSAAPRPVALTANQSVADSRSSPAVATAATDGDAAATAEDTSADESSPSNGLFGMSPYGLPPPPSELMDLRNPLNMALLDFVPSNPSDPSRDQGSRSRPATSSSTSSSTSQPVFCEADIVLLD